MTDSKEGWTPERELILAAAIADRKTAAQAAELILDSAGRAVFSRSALIGKARRLKLAFHPDLKSLPPRAGARKGGRPRGSGRPARPGALAAPRRHGSSGKGAEPASEAPSALPAFVPPARLGPWCCKWPIGNPRAADFRYCGEVREGWGAKSVDSTALPYCPQHCDEAWPKRARAA